MSQIDQLRLLSRYKHSSQTYKKGFKENENTFRREPPAVLVIQYMTSHMYTYSLSIILISSHVFIKWIHLNDGNEEDKFDVPKYYKNNKKCAFVTFDIIVRNN